MKRRGTEMVQLSSPPKKRSKAVEELSPGLDVSFYDDEALPSGIVFSDIQQRKWRIGKPIGRGSFGRIYLASDDVDKEVTKANARYVVKIEPHTNGPLFVEIHCLIRTANVQNVRTWRYQKKLKRLGMPVYIASGSFTDQYTGIKYRFLVLPRYDIDLQKIIARTKVLDLKNVLVLAVQILDVLEYLHEQGYTHSDIKSSNLMLGFDPIKMNKLPLTKIPSFQKEIKEVAVLSGKQRRSKTAKSKVSNYYEDEDFVVKEFKGNSSEDEAEDKRLLNVKKKLRKILSDKDCRTLHRHHAFNLRQLPSYVNYEDLNSSVCSDQSYQNLLDDFGTKQLKLTSENYTEVDVTKQKKSESVNNVDEIHKEAILSQSNGQIYLLDYGLASKFVDIEGNHKDFGMDARKAHDGTLEYSSRDSHIGAHSRRSDLETLAYNLLDWLTGTLPWKTTELLAEPDLVHALKKNFMGDIKLFLKTCFKTEFFPQFMEKYLEYVTNLEFTDKPDYEYCKSLFRSELLRNGYERDISLNFAESPKSPVGRKLCYSKRFGKKNTTPTFLSRNGIKKTYERENLCSLENDFKLDLLKQALNLSNDGIRKPCTSRNFFISDADLVARLKKSLMPLELFGKKLSPKNLRSNKKNVKKRRGVRRHRNSIGKFGNFMGSARQFTWAEILAGNPEDIIRKERNTTHQEEDDEEECKYRIRKLSNASAENNESNQQSPLLQKDYFLNTTLTYAMKEVLAAFKKKISGKIVKDEEEPIEGLEGYTPAMVKVYRLKAKREAKEKADALKQHILSKKTSPVIVLPRCTRASKSCKNLSKSLIKRTASTDKNKKNKEMKQNKQPRSTRKKVNTQSKDKSETDKTIKGDKIKCKSTKSPASKESSKEKMENSTPKTRKIKQTANTVEKEVVKKVVYRRVGRNCKSKDNENVGNKKPKKSESESKVRTSTRIRAQKHPANTRQLRSQNN